MSIERKHIVGAVEAAADQDTAVPQIAASSLPAAPDRPAERRAVVVVPLPAGAAAPEPGAARSPGPSQRDIHVAANLRELVAATPLAPQAERLAKEQRDLNAIVHGVLIAGLLVSTALMLAGVGLALLYQRDLPTAVPDVGEVISRVLALRPSGFLALGLLVLIATPILRVIGSIGAFLYERDWRFAAITSLVLGVLVVSLLLGRG
jgi:uncharacterized membrane protein